MNVKQVLRDFNLKKVEVDFYLACLELGNSSASQIAKKSKIERTYIYDIAKSLQQKGLIAITFSKGKKQFLASSPDKLKVIQEENLKKLEEVLPQLKSMQRTPGEKPKISFYEGIDGIEQILVAAMKYKGEIKGFTSERFLTTKDKYFETKITKLRVKRGISTRFIGPVSKELEYFKKTGEEKKRQIKMLPQDLFSSDIEIFTFGNNNVAILNYKQEFGLIIESYDIAHVLDQIFELIWRGGFVIG
jgi:HTH-type transcriptional regulator, sugar sensing transcriptional regulator